MGTSYNREVNMTLKLENNYYIKTDSYNFMLCKTIYTSDPNAKSKSYEITLTYHINLESALNSYVNELIRDGIDANDHTLVTVRDMLKDIRESLKRIAVEL